MLLRRVRAAAVLGFMWALLCVPLGAAIQLAFAWWVVDFPVSGRDLWNLVLTGASTGAIWGLVSGLVFAAALAVLERRGGVDHLSRRRVVGWGALSGATFPIVMTAMSFPSVAIVLADIAPYLVIVGAGAVYGAVVGGGLLTAALGAKRIEGA